MSQLSRIRWLTQDEFGDDRFHGSCSFRFFPNGTWPLTALAANGYTYVQEVCQDMLFCIGAGPLGNLQKRGLRSDNHEIGCGSSRLECSPVFGSDFRGTFVSLDNPVRLLEKHVNHYLELHSPQWH